jgi:hypothetical protein
MFCKNALLERMSFYQCGLTNWRDICSNRESATIFECVRLFDRKRCNGGSLISHCSNESAAPTNVD